MMESIKLLLSTLIYACLFHYIYIEYLTDIFGYAYYNYIPRELSEYILCYLFVIAPVLFYRDNRNLANVASSIIYVLIYIPGTMMLLFMWKFSFGEWFISIMMLCVCMILLFFGGYLNFNNSGDRVFGTKVRWLIHALTSLGCILIIYAYKDTMSFVGFDKVYDLRESANAKDHGVVIDYSLVWVTFLSIPYYISNGLVTKSFKDIVIGIIVCVIVYMAQGAKIAILSAGIIIALWYVFESGKNILYKLISSSVLVFLAVVFLLPNEGFWRWTKSIFMVRIYSNGGWSLVTYYEYFKEYGYTFYSHIGPLNRIFDYYPYGDYSLGQLIGIKYSGSSDANFNANFWSSDGFAALGYFGLLPVTLALFSFLLLINYASRNHSLTFASLFMTGFIMSLLNLPLSTALLSGGGGIGLLFFIIDSVRIKNGKYIH